MTLSKNTVGRKIIMSVTGISMIAFVVAHLIGNSSIYFGSNGINAYAQTLHRFAPFLLMLRLTMVVMLSLHVLYGIVLTIENRAARPDAYAVSKDLSTTFAGKNMIWTGLLIGTFLIFHLLHFTFQVIIPEAAANRHFDLMGRPDVFMMVAFNFRKIFVSLVYVCAMGAMGLHLAHSIQSALQTLGLNSERVLPVVIKAGTVAAALIFLGYAAVPIAFLSGALR